MFKAISLIVSILIVFTTGCNKKMVAQVCKPIVKENKEFDLIGLNISSPNIKGKSFILDSQKNSQIIDSIIIEESQFQDYFNNLCKDIDNRRFLSILYINKFVNKNDKIDSTNILAVGNYYYYDKYYIFKLFSKKNGQYIENKALTTKTYGITNNSINDIGESIIFRNSSNYTFIEINKRGNFYNIKREELLYDKIQQFKKKQKY